MLFVIYIILINVYSSFDITNHSSKNTNNNMHAGLRAVVGRKISLDISSYLPKKQSGGDYSLSLRGLPDNSGLQITAKGVITGQATIFDAFAKQPLAITVVVTQGSLSSKQKFYVLVAGMWIMRA